MASSLQASVRDRAQGIAGYWDGDVRDLHSHGAALLPLIADVRTPVHVVRMPSGMLGLSARGSLRQDRETSFPVLGIVPPLYPEWLGNRQFQKTHHTRFGYVLGEMAHGISSVRMVIAAARAGMLGFLGTAGLPLADVDQMFATVRDALDPAGQSWGANLVSMPEDPGFEAALTDLCIRQGVRRVCASAFMDLTTNLVRYACTGLTRTPDGTIHRRHHLLAKVSRPEVARLFMAAPPPAMLDALVRSGALTAEEAALGSRLSLADDITLEADSAGHTDSRPLAVLFPRIAALREEIACASGLCPVRLGAAGGLGTPAAVAAAFALGADYVLTGSINQAAVESGISADARAMLAEADMADVTLAPSGDMFELGVKVQVLRRGTFFAARARLLYELYSTHDSLDALPVARREQLEREIFRMPLDQVWAETVRYLEERRPALLERATRDPRYRMALTFRWYFAQSARWPIAGETSRRSDYQLWCGPAMGGFNAWVAGSFLEPLHERTVEQIGKNLLEGAAVILRAQQFRAMGVAVPAAAFQFVPRRLA